MRGAEEMDADHHIGPRCGAGDLVDIQCRCIRSEHAIAFSNPVDFAEDLLLQRHVLEHGFDDDVGVSEAVVCQLRLNQSEPFFHLLRGQSSLFHG